jgi:hypothetical protein
MTSANATSAPCRRGPSLRALAAAIKAPWVCEQGRQQSGRKLGLGHFEGRSWAGLRLHCADMTALLPELRRMAADAVLPRLARRAALAG